MQNKSEAYLFLKRSMLSFIFSMICLTYSNAWRSCFFFLSIENKPILCHLRCTEQNAQVSFDCKNAQGYGQFIVIVHWSSYVRVFDLMIN